MYAFVTSDQLLWLLVSINKTQLGCNYSILRGVYILSLFAGYTIVMDVMPHGRNVQTNHYVLWFFSLLHHTLLLLLHHPHKM